MRLNIHHWLGTLVISFLPIILIGQAAPVRPTAGSFRSEKDRGHVETKKSFGKFEKPEKKSTLKRRTTVSINGHVLPLASLSTSDKNIHLTVQKADSGSQPPQASIQELTPGAQVPGALPVGMSPGVPVSQLPGPQQAVGMSPGVSVPQIPAPQQALGMSPGYQPPVLPVVQNPGLQLPASQVGLHPGIQAPSTLSTGGQGNQFNALGTINCAQSQNLQAQGVQNNRSPVVLGTNSEGQLTYRPVAC